MKGMRIMQRLILDNYDGLGVMQQHDLVIYFLDNRLLVCRKMELLIRWTYSGKVEKIVKVYKGV